MTEAELGIIIGQPPTTEVGERLVAAEAARGAPGDNRAEDHVGHSIPPRCPIKSYDTRAKIFVRRTGLARAPVRSMLPRRALRSKMRPFQTRLIPDRQSVV